MNLMSIATFTLLSLSAPQTEKVEADEVKYKSKTLIDFSDMRISGELVKPEGSYLSIRRQSSFRSLIKLRGDFRPELVTSLDAL